MESVNRRWLNWGLFVYKILLLHESVIILTKGKAIENINSHGIKSNGPPWAQDVSSFIGRRFCNFICNLKNHSEMINCIVIHKKNQNHIENKLPGVGQVDSNDWKSDNKVCFCSSSSMTMIGSSLVIWRPSIAFWINLV